MQTLPDFISIEWHIEDVKYQAKNDDIKITDDQAREVLSYIKHKHDANIGVNWDFISHAIREVVNE